MIGELNFVPYDPSKKEALRKTHVQQTSAQTSNNREIEPPRASNPTDSHEKQMVPATNKGLPRSPGDDTAGGGQEPSPQSHESSIRTKRNYHQDQGWYYEHQIRSRNRQSSLDSAIIIFNFDDETCWFYTNKPTGTRGWSQYRAPVPLAQREASDCIVTPNPETQSVGKSPSPLVPRHSNPESATERTSISPRTLVPVGMMTDLTIAISMQNMGTVMPPETQRQVLI